MTKEKKGFRNTILAAALFAFLAGGIKTGAQEIKLERKTEPFSLETTLSYDNFNEKTFDADLDFFGEYKFDSGYKILGNLRVENGLPSKIVLAAGHPNMYIGAKWENLSEETSLLKDTNLFKFESGVRNIADCLDISTFIAYTSIPNMKTRWKAIIPKGKEFYDTPLQLYSFGANCLVKPKFELKNSAITPWISGNIIFNKALAQNTENIDNNYNLSSFEWPFNHFDLGLGADFSTKNLDFGLENYWEGNYDSSLSLAPLFGTRYKAKISLHNEKSFLRYSFTANPQFNWLDWPASWDFQSDLDFRFHFTSEIYSKGNLSINHSTTQNPNLIAALGYLQKDGTNIELFCNLESKIIGITFSNRNLGNKLERYSQKPFAEIALSPVNVYTTQWDRGNVATIHSIYGENISDVIDYISAKAGGNYQSAMKEISKYASYFEWTEDNHIGSFSPEKEHDLGYGVCRDTNGKLLPTIINGVLGNKGYQSWGKMLAGPYVGHVVTIIKKPNKKYDIMDYDCVYYLDTETEQGAIDKVYPGVYAYDGGKHSETAQRVISALGESVWR